MSHITPFSRARFVAMLGVILWLCAIIPSSVRASIIDHSGSAQPDGTEGWNLATFYGDSDASAVNNDRGEDAWSVGKNDENAELVYTYNMSSDQIDKAETLGWTMSVRLRVVNADDTPDFAVSVHFGVGSTRYDMNFGSSGNNPVVMLVTNFSGNGINPTGPSYTVDDPDGGYHDYKLVYDAVSGGADLFIDGVERISNYAGTPNAPGVANVFFGSAGNDGTGRANYSRISLSVPEPSSATLLLIGAVGLLRRRRRA